MSCRGVGAFVLLMLSASILAVNSCKIKAIRIQVSIKPPISNVTILFNAIKSGDLTSFREAATSAFVDVESVLDSTYLNASALDLMNASPYGANAVAMMRTLVEERGVRSVDLPLSRREGRTALMTAVENSPTYGTAATLYLLAQNALVNAETIFGMTPLRFACLLPNPGDMIDLLAAKGAGVNKISTDGLTPLHFAITLKKPAAVSKLLQKGAITSSLSTAGQNALHYAINSDNTEIINAILNSGINFEALTYASDKNALHFAVVNKRKIAVQLLLQNGADPNAVTSSGKTALMLLAELYFNTTTATADELVTLLVAGGATPGLTSAINGRTALWGCLQNINSPVDIACIKRFVVDLGLSPTDTDSSGVSFDNYACSSLWPAATRAYIWTLTTCPCSSC